MRLSYRTGLGSPRQVSYKHNFSKAGGEALPRDKEPPGPGPALPAPNSLSTFSSVLKPPARVAYCPLLQTHYGPCSACYTP